MGFFWGVDQDAIVDLLKKLFFDKVRPPKPGKSSFFTLCFGPRSQSIGRGRLSREGALDHRESRERRDKIFAAKTVNRQNFQKKNGSGKLKQFSVGNFHFFDRGKTHFFGGDITSKLAS